MSMTTAAPGARSLHTTGVKALTAGPYGVFPLKWPLQLSGEFVYVSES
ncbi:UNVERIFIED_ORG: hypothetical protein EDC92_1534 [Dietzia maris]